MCKLVLSNEVAWRVVTIKSTMSAPNFRRLPKKCPETETYHFINKTDKKGLEPL